MAHAVLPVGSRHRIEVTDRDVAILLWITRHGVVTVEQIARRLFPGSSGLDSARRRVRKLANAHPPLIRRDRTFWRQPPVIRTTASGANLGGCDLRPARLVYAEIAHSLGIVDLTEELLAEHPDATLITERERRAERYREKGQGTRRATGRIPDAVFLLPGNPKKVAVELDLSPRREKTVEAIVRAYQSERYGAVWWYVLPARAPRIAGIIRKLRADSFIEVRKWNGSRMTQNP